MSLPMLSRAALVMRIRRLIKRHFIVALGLVLLVLLASDSQLRRHICRGEIVIPLFPFIRSQFLRVELTPEAKCRILQNYRNFSVFSTYWSGTVPDKSDYVKEATPCFIKSESKFKRMCVPTDIRLRTRIIEEQNEFSPIAVHPGNRRTFLCTAEWYKWKSIQQEIKEYVKSCETCTRWKPT